MHPPTFFYPYPWVGKFAGRAAPRRTELLAARTRVLQVI